MAAETRLGTMARHAYTVGVITPCCNYDDDDDDTSRSRQTARHQYFIPCQFVSFPWNNILFTQNHTNHILLARWLHVKEILFSDNKFWSLAKLVRATSRKLLYSNHKSWPFAKSHVPNKLFSGWTIIMDMFRRRATNYSFLVTRVELLPKITAPKFCS